MDKELLQKLKNALKLLIEARPLGQKQVADGGLSLTECKILDSTIGNVRFLVESEIKRP